MAQLNTARRGLSPVGTALMIIMVVVLVAVVATVASGYLGTLTDAGEQAEDITGGEIAETSTPTPTPTATPDTDVSLTTDLSGPDWGSHELTITVDDGELDRDETIVAVGENEYQWSDYDDDGAFVLDTTDNGGSIYGEPLEVRHSGEVIHAEQL